MKIDPKTNVLDLGLQLSPTLWFHVQVSILHHILHWCEVWTSMGQAFDFCNTHISFRCLKIFRIKELAGPTIWKKIRFKELLILGISKKRWVSWKNWQIPHGFRWIFHFFQKNWKLQLCIITRYLIFWKPWSYIKTMYVLFW